MNTSDSTEAAYRVEPDARCRNFTGAQMSAFGRTPTVRSGGRGPAARAYTSVCSAISSASSTSIRGT